MPNRFGYYAVANQFSLHMHEMSHNSTSCMIFDITDELLDPDFLMGGVFPLNYIVLAHFQTN
jgi:hypothetical protein